MIDKMMTQLGDRILDIEEIIGHPPLKDPVKQNLYRQLSVLMGEVEDQLDLPSTDFC